MSDDQIRARARTDERAAEAAYELGLYDLGADEDDGHRGPRAVPSWLPETVLDNGARRSLLAAGRFRFRRRGALRWFHHAISRRWYHLHPRIRGERVCLRQRPVGWGPRLGWLYYA